jgi:hypothetical protein
MSLALLALGVPPSYAALAGLDTIGLCAQSLPALCELCHTIDCTDGGFYATLVPIHVPCVPRGLGRV